MAHISAKFILIIILIGASCLFSIHSALDSSRALSSGELGCFHHQHEHRIVLGFTAVQVRKRQRQTLTENQFDAQLTRI